LIINVIILEEVSKPQASNEIHNFYEPYYKIHSPHVVSIIKNIYKKKLHFYAGDGDNERPRVL